MDTLSLLWRKELPAEPRRGRPPRLSLEAVIAAGIQVADQSAGLDFSLRMVSDRLGVGVMTLYSYAESKDQLLELMIDECRATMAFGVLRGAWRRRLQQVAAENLALLAEHPWLANVESERAVLGPGTLGKYERELGAVEPLPLDDVAKDAALTLVLDFVRANARAKAAAAGERAQEAPQEWWQREGSRLAALGVGERYPLAQRIGTAAGTATNAARDADHAYRFGLKVILDGIGRRLAG